LAAPAFEKRPHRRTMNHGPPDLAAPGPEKRPHRRTMNHGPPDLAASGPEKAATTPDDAPSRALGGGKSPSTRRVMAHGKSAKR
ncbi:MAG: hypothetical protein RIF41_35600, partial [Polyangiaceae bacterium]